MVHLWDSYPVFLSSVLGVFTVIPAERIKEWGRGQESMALSLAQKLFSGSKWFCYFMHFDNIGMKTDMNLSPRNSDYFKHVTKRNFIIKSL